MSIKFYLFPPSIRSLPWVLPQHVHLSQLTSLCQSAQVRGSGKKLQHTTRSFFGSVSLYGVSTNAAQLRNARWTQCMCVVSKESFITCPFACCFSSTSFHLTFLREFALAFHTCVHFNKTFLHVFVTRDTWQTKTSKNTIQMTFQKTLKFLLHTCYTDWELQTHTRICLSMDLTYFYPHSWGQFSM